MNWVIPNHWLYLWLLNNGITELITHGYPWYNQGERTTMNQYQPLQSTMNQPAWIHLQLLVENQSLINSHWSTTSQCVITIIHQPSTIIPQPSSNHWLSIHYWLLIWVIPIHQLQIANHYQPSHYAMAIHHDPTIHSHQPSSKHYQPSNIDLA